MDYWQFWRNTDDRDVKRFLNFFTDINSTKIDKLVSEEKYKQSKNFIR